jgi:hypothetical protein
MDMNLRILGLVSEGIGGILEQVLKGPFEEFLVGWDWRRCLMSLLDMDLATNMG